MTKVNSDMVTNLFLIIIFMIIIFQTLADTASDVGDAADNITAASDTYPLTSFFKKKGVVLLALMAGVAIVLVKSVLPSSRK